MRSRRVSGRAVVLVAVLLLGAVAAPGSSHAQSAGPPRVGWLSFNAATQFPAQIEAFRQGLRELGYVEGKSIVIETRFADARQERLLDLAAELLRSSVSVIVAANPPALQAAQQATRALPIVTRMSDDPVASGLVASLARPGGNITGVYSLVGELDAKRLELLRDAIPGLARVALLMNSATPGSAPRLAESEAAARRLGLQLQVLDATRPEALAPAFRSATAARAQALITLRNPVIVINLKRVVGLAAESRLPAMYDSREFVDAGGLMAYGTSLTELYRRMATYVDKILKGARPGDLPIEQPTTFELAVDLRTARALGLTIPPSFLQRADRVIR